MRKMRKSALKISFRSFQLNEHMESHMLRWYKRSIGYTMRRYDQYEGNVAIGKMGCEGVLLCGERCCVLCVRRSWIRDSEIVSQDDDLQGKLTITSLVWWYILCDALDFVEMRTMCIVVRIVMSSRSFVRSHLGLERCLTLCDCVCVSVCKCGGKSCVKRDDNMQWEDRKLVGRMSYGYCNGTRLNRCNCWLAPDKHYWKDQKVVVGWLALINRWVNDGR